MIKFELVTLDGVKYSQEVYEIQLPTPDGYAGIYPEHSPLVSIVSPGIVKVREQQNHPDDMMESFAINGGVADVTANSVKVLVDEADAPEDINEAEIQKALEHAKQLRSEAKDQVSLDHAQQLIDRQAVRLQVAGLKRRGRGQKKRIES